MENKELTEKEFDEIVTDTIVEDKKDEDTLGVEEMLQIQEPEKQDFSEITGECDDVENISEANDEADE